MSFYPLAFFCLLCVQILMALRYVMRVKFPGVEYPVPDLRQILRTAAVRVRIAIGQRLFTGRLSGLRLYHASLRSVTFCHARLNCVDMQKATLEDVAFDNCTSRALNMVQATGRIEILAGFHDEIALCEARMELHVWSARLHQMDARGATFLPNSRFSLAWISSCSEERGFHEAVLDNVVFLKCTLRDVDFTRASLRGAKFIDCDIIECDFTDADLRNTHFGISRLVRVSGVEALSYHYSAARPATRCSTSIVWQPERDSARDSERVAHVHGLDGRGMRRFAASWDPHDARLLTALETATRKHAVASGATMARIVGTTECVTEDKSREVLSDVASGMADGPEGQA